MAPKAKRPERERYRRPAGEDRMTVEQANGFATNMRPLFGIGLSSPLSWLTDYCTQALGVQVGHFRDLSYSDARRVYFQAKKEFS